MIQLHKIFQKIKNVWNELFGQHKSDKPKRKIETQPWEIGGRRISPGPRGETVEPGDYERAPKLICRENGSSSKFDVILIVPESYPVNSILLNNKKLSVGNHPSEYPLHPYSGKLIIDRTDGKRIEINLPKENPLIFKLKKNWRGDGNSHPYLTIGYFVIIAPNRWTRQGNAPVEDMACSDSSFQAHFFHIDESNEKLEETPFKEYSVPLKKHCLNLKGKVLPDKSVDGKLFVQNPPNLAPDSNVKWARVGYEGINDWGQNFKPNEEQVSAVLAGKCGHFFIRVYDEKVNLMDSDQFRFSSALNRIFVNGESYEDDDKLIPPPKEGHKPTTLRFVDTNGKNIVPLNKNIEGTIENDGVVFLHPVPGNDTTKWKLPSGQDCCVSVVIELQRIWWQKKLPKDESGEWLDKPIELTRDEFRELAKEKTILEFLPKRSNGSLRIGFDDKLDIKRNIRDEIALSDFLYHKPIAEPSNEESILKILIDDSKIDLIMITADQFTIPPALDRILVNGKLYEEDDKLIPPPKGGHKPTTLRFVDTNDKNIVPLDKIFDGTVKDDGAVFLHPVPSNDTTKWKLPSGQDCVSAVIELQRIWWQMKLPEDETGEWLDKPIELTRDEFRELAKKKTILEFLPKRSNGSLRIGFDDKLDIKRNIRDEIALSDFLYHKPIAEPSNEESILKILADDSEIDLIVIKADQFTSPPALDRILVDGKLYEEDDKLIPPPKGGHKPTTLRFVDTNDKNIVPLDKIFDGTVKDDGAVFLHPVPGNDTTKWKLPSGQDCVSAVIELQRIWWQIKLPEDESGEWLDKPIALTREEFRELAEKNTILKFLPKRSNESMRIGFDDKLDIERNIRDEIALSDFLYHKPIAEPSSEESILKILIDDSEINLIVILADQEVDENYNPKVFGGDSRFRQGRGFSKSEVERAGISIQDLRRLKLPFDKHRRSSHIINIKLLKKVKTDA